MDLNLEFLKFTQRDILVNRLGAIKHLKDTHQIEISKQKASMIFFQLAELGLIEKRKALSLHREDNIPLKNGAIGTRCYYVITDKGLDALNQLKTTC